MRALANRVPFDERGNEAIKIDDISGVLVYEHLKTVKSKLAENFISRPLIEILDEMDLLAGPQENRLIKNVAAMMFCEHPEKFFPVTQVDIVIFPEGSIENPDLMIEAPRITGPVPKMIKEALSYLRINVIKKKIAKPSDREESDKTYNYPYQAFEECISNALYHRDYQEREPVEITVEPTHVDILSYAGPDRSISNDAIKAAKKLKARRYRNRRLGDFLKELDLTEGRATGIPTIQKALKDNGSAPATIETDDDRTYFLMTIPCRDGFARKLSEDDFDVNSGWTNRLGQTLGQISVQVQEIIKQSVITDKEQLGQLLGQLTVEVWNKSKRKEDIAKMSEYVINILSLLKENSYSASSLIKILNFGDSKDFKRKLLNPMISSGYIGMLYPDKPTSAKQAYQLTDIGLTLFGS